MARKGGCWERRCRREARREAWLDQQNPQSMTAALLGKKKRKPQAKKKASGLGEFQEGRSDHTGTKLVLVLAAGLGALWWVRRGQRREEAAAEARWSERMNPPAEPAPVVARATW